METLKIVGRSNNLLIGVVLLLYNTVVWAHGAVLPKDIEDLALQQLTDNVYIIQGPQAFPSP